METAGLSASSAPFSARSGCARQTPDRWWIPLRPRRHRGRRSKDGPTGRVTRPRRYAPLPMISSEQEGLTITVAPAMAWLVEGGSAAQRSSQISAAIHSSGSCSQHKRIRVPKGTDSSTDTDRIVLRRRRSKPAQLIKFAIIGKISLGNDCKESSILYKNSTIIQFAFKKERCSDNGNQIRAVAAPVRICSSAACACWSRVGCKNRSPQV